MRKDLGFFINLILFSVFFSFSGICFADDIILPDFRLSADKRLEKIFKNGDKITYQAIRNNHSFAKFFDSLIIEIYKKSPEKNMSPSDFGKAYLARKGFCDNKFEKYIIEDNNGKFFAAWCSQNMERCEIIKVERGYDGLINIRYIHNNLWHFQNNIGSFVEVVRRTTVIPFEFQKRLLVQNKNFVRL